jgi:hypothetical protein
MLWEDNDLEMECVQSQDWTVVFWLATQTRKKDAEEEKKKRRSFSFKGGILRAVISNSFVFIMIAAGLCFVIYQGWPQRCCHTSLVRLVQAVCHK